MTLEPANLAPFPNPYTPGSDAWHTFERHWANEAKTTADAQRAAREAMRQNEEGRKDQKSG